MSWQAASLVVLALALIAGFGWYERDRPPARILALVATMAALAVVGRLAFAAIPNVKPTTDIVLFAGYALGAVPGFAVGAVTAVVSNVFLSQGPWTPWQMVGWGAVGVGGAALALAMRGREPSRLVLAAVCGLAGLAFGAWMDLYQLTLAAHQDLDTYLALSASSLPYNLAHAIGNVVFCLLIGPVFIRALRRYRRRLEVHWRAPVGAAAATLLLALALGLPAAAGAASPAERAERWLARTQNKDGGFGPVAGQSSSALFSGWAGLGLAAAGHNPRDLRRPGGRSLAAYVDTRRGLAQGRRRDRAHDPRGRGGRAVGEGLRGQGPRRGCSVSPPRRRVDRGLCELHRLWGDRSARGGSPGGQGDGVMARLGAERGRRLRARAVLGERQRHDRRDAASARDRRPSAWWGGDKSGGLAARQPKRRRRLRPVQGAQLKRTIHELRDPGTGGGGRRRRDAVALARLPARAAALERQRRLFLVERRRRPCGSPLRR